jgi:hypothetical protein
MPRHSRPVFSAAIRLDPEPRKGSRTISPRFGQVDQRILQHCGWFHSWMPPIAFFVRTNPILVCNQETFISFASTSPMNGGADIQRAEGGSDRKVSFDRTNQFVVIRIERRRRRRVAEVLQSTRFAENPLTARAVAVIDASRKRQRPQFCVIDRISERFWTSQR